jgi:putative SOS response-associated peptidase YedK
MLALVVERVEEQRRWRPRTGEWPLITLPAPYPSDEMICWPVSTRVGNVKNNDPSLIEPVAAA